MGTIADKAREMSAWIILQRRHLHAHPELGFDVGETADFTASCLEEIGATDVLRGVWRSDVTAMIEGTREGGALALRADMDALPVEEEMGLSFASSCLRRMRACGHAGPSGLELAGHRRGPMILPSAIGTRSEELAARPQPDGRSS